MSKRSATEDTRETKKVKSENFNLAYIIPKVHELNRRIGDYMGICNISISHNLETSLKYASDAIPQLTVCGSQSSGKSTVLHGLFGVKLPIGTGTCTLCPIEIRTSPDYSDSIYVETAGIKTPWDSIEAAAAFVKTTTNGNLTLDIVIVNEVHADCNIIVTDLPGIKSDIRYREYFTAMRTRYLCKPQTVVFHVTRGDTDPDSDVSLEYLKGLPNPVVPVLTNTDVWESDVQKREYIRHHEKNTTSDVIALVNNRSIPNEIALLTTVAPASSKSLVIGKSALRDYILKLLETKTRESIPIIRPIIIDIRKKLEDEFLSIGRQAPDMKELAGELKRVLTDRATKEFGGSGSQLAIATNQSNNNISPKIILDGAAKLIPSQDKIADDMEQGSRRKLRGSEGWDDVVQKTTQTIIDALKQHIIEVFIRDHGEIVRSQSKAIFDQAYRPASVQAQENLKQSIDNIVDKHLEKTRESIIDSLDNIANYQYSADSSYASNWARATVEGPVTLVVKYLVSLQAPTDKLREVSINPAAMKELIDHVAGGMPATTYKLKATQAWQQLTSFWKSKSVEIHTSIVEDVSTFERKVENSIKDSIMDISHTDLSEPEIIDRKRSHLRAIADLCDDIIKQL